jgi:hypothetical protein
MEYIDSSIRIAKTWAFGAAAIATVMAFMPFAAVIIFLSPFYEISPIRVQLILAKNAEDEEDENDDSDSEASDGEDEDEDEEDENEDEDEQESVDVSPEPETIYTHRPDLKERRDVYLQEVEEDADEARANGFPEKAQQLEDVARILRTLWEIPKSAKTNEQSEEKPDTTPLREAAPLPEEDADRIAILSGTGKTGQTYTVDAIIEESKDKDKDA